MRYIKLLALSSIIVWLSSPLLHTKGFDDFMDETSSFGESAKTNMGIAASGFFGINDPLNGYKTYRTNPALGGDVRLLFYTQKHIKYYASIAVDILPLALPEDVIDSTQNNVSVNANFIYMVNRFSWYRSIPYVGIGTGYYWDTLEQNIPGFGTRSDTSVFWGFNWHVGLEYRFKDNISISPQCKVHYIKQPEIYAAILMYSAHITYYFGKDTYYHAY